MHILVGDFYAIIQIAHGITDLQPDVPQRIQHAINQLRKKRLRLGSVHLTIVQKHEINVAVRIQFRAAKTADGYQRNLRKFF